MSNLEELPKRSKDEESFAKMMCEMMFDMFEVSQEIRLEISKMEEKKEELVDRTPWISSPYYVTSPGILSVYDAAEKATLRGLEEGEALPFTVQHANESPGYITDQQWLRQCMGLDTVASAETSFLPTQQKITTSKDIEFDKKDMQSVVATTDGIPVVVPQQHSITCPQGHHLKDGKCMRDYCWCLCPKCKYDCGEK